MKKSYFFLVIVVGGILIASLTIATWHINFWPTDAEDFYIDAAKNFPALKFISQMHESMDQAKIKWLHGKEIFIVCSSFFQRIFHDEKTLRPLIFVCILSIGFSSILIFFLARGFWGEAVGWACFLVFTTSFWPYLYILFVKHHPLGLFFFLLALYFLCYPPLNKWRQGIFSFFSGVCLCLSIYSSTVSVLYIPYYLAGFLYVYLVGAGLQEKRGKLFANFILGTIFIFIGFAIVFFEVNYPHIIDNVKGYLAYATISRDYSHFYYNQPVLIQWIPHPGSSVRGGWVWVFKYFLLIMPVLFPVYLLCLCYLVWRFFRVTDNRRELRLTTCGLILLSFSSPILAESRGVAQYGANYFSSFIGILMLTGYTFFVFLKSDWLTKADAFKKRVIFSAIFLGLALHAIVNFYIFATDIYPCRMATTFLSRTIEKLGVSEIYSYPYHPCRRNMVDCLDPKLTNKLHFLAIQNIDEVKEGYILLPPVTGDSIYIDVPRNAYHDFDRDLYLNEIIKQGRLKDYAVASYDTLSSSRIWPHEEEILSYRILILNHLIPADRPKTQAWLLDAKKLQQDALKNAPSPAEINLARSGIRNIGTQTKRHMYEGEIKQLVKPLVVQTLPVKLYKVGEPHDSLVAYIYKPTRDEGVWVPLNEHFASRWLDAKDIPSDTTGRAAIFEFSKPLFLIPGFYRIVIYRTGKSSDKNFYRIYTAPLPVIFTSASQ